MPELTILLKSCGHYGMITERYSNDQITCSQCEIAGTAHHVHVTKQKVLETIIPKLSFNEMDKWIRKQLDES